MISGSRTATTAQDEQKIQEALNNLKPTHILTGGAQGADAIAEKWAKQNGVKTTVIKPNYTKYGQTATHQRNDELLKLSDKVLCYYGTNDGTKTPGTASVATKARKQGKLLKELYRTPGPTLQTSLF